MKVKNINFKVAVFAVAAIALSSAVVYTINSITAPNNTAQQGVYAAEAQKIAVATARANIVNEGSYVAGYHVNALDISILLSEGQVKAGDFIEIKFNNINAERNVFENREIRINDEIIGVLKYATSSQIGQGMSFESQPLGTGISSYTYNLVFNENMEKYKNRNIEIDAENLLGWQTKTTKDYEITQSIEVNGVVAGSKKTQVRAVKPTEPYGSYSVFNRVWLSTRDGETIDSDGVVAGIAQQYKRPETRLQVGDIVEYNIPSDFGVAFNEELGRVVDLVEPLNNYSEFDLINPRGVLGNNQKRTKVKIIEASPHRVRVQITEIEGDAYDAIVTLRAKIIDTSPKTINYEESKLVEAKNTTRILRNNKEIYKGSQNLFGDITGAKLKAYAQNRKRGSIIRQIIDEDGNKIEGFESDKLILERVQEGTPYSVEAPRIEGLVLKRLDANSAPQSGVVKEGVQNVIFVYGKPELPKEEPKIEETPEIKEEPKKEEIQAPDTGFEGRGILAAILSGISTMIILTTIFFRKK